MRLQLLCKCIPPFLPSSKLSHCLLELARQKQSAEGMDFSEGTATTMQLCILKDIASQNAKGDSCAANCLPHAVHLGWEGVNSS